jgi:HAD superfamily hydrolase (TIGR01509 family)
VSERNHKAVLFDLDDTLFDHRHSSRHGLVVLRRRLPALRAPSLDALEAQHGVLLEELHRRVIEGDLELDEARIERFRRLLELCGGAADREAATRAAETYRGAYLRSRRPVPGAVELLETLVRLKPGAASQGRRFRIGIVSNNLLAEQVDKLRCCRLDRYIDALVVSEQAGASKPDPAIFDIALRELGCAPDETVMIGDSWMNDVAGARAAGIAAVWFNRWRLPRPEPDGDVMEIHTLARVRSVLR